MLMEQVFKDRKINLKSINMIWSKMQKNMHIQNTKEESGCCHTFIGKLTIGTHTYFIKFMSQIDYTAYHEHKAQDIAKQVF